MSESETDGEGCMDGWLVGEIINGGMEGVAGAIFVFGFFFFFLLIIIIIITFSHRSRRCCIPPPSSRLRTPWMRIRADVISLWLT